MVDIWRKEKRSDVMSRIRSAGNKETELRLIAIMRQFRIAGWRRQQVLPGKPDFTFRKEKLAVFVDGCFWHGCPRCYRRPSSNRRYWDAKIEGNRQRDKRVAKDLRQAGWRVLRLWDHQLKEPARVARQLRNKLAAGVRAGQ